MQRMLLIMKKNHSLGQMTYLNHASVLSSSGSCISLEYPHHYQH